MSLELVQGGLFPFSSTPSKATQRWKTFRAKGGTEVRYLCDRDRTVKIDFGFGELPVSQQAQERLYTLVPGYGQIRERGWQRFMSKAAMVRQIMEARAEGDAARTREREAVDQLIATHQRRSAKPRQRNTLCTEPQPMTWEARTIVPIKLATELAAVCKPGDGPAFSMQFLWLEEREEPSPGAKRVYSRLSTYAGPAGVSKVSYRTLAKAVGMSPRQTIKLLQWLCDWHLIRPRGFGKRGLVYYEFLWHPWIEEWLAALPSGELSSPDVVNLVPPIGEVSSPKKREEKRNSKDVSSAQPANPHPAGSPNDEEDHCEVEELKPQQWRKR